VNPRRRRSVAVVGAGPAGTALALGLLRAGHTVTLVSDRTGDEVRSGRVMSSQITFESALEAEVSLGVSDLLPDAPPIEEMAYDGRRADGSLATFRARLAGPARSIDQRVRLPLLLDQVARLGGNVQVRSATPDDLLDLARGHDLVVVCSGRGGLAELFPIDDERTPYETPQRVAALTYLASDSPGNDLRYHAVDGVGECFSCPAVTLGGPCRILVVEGVPGGPLDCWEEIASPQAHVDRLRAVLAEHFPAEAAFWAGDMTLVDDQAWLHGRFRPVVRQPVGRLADGSPVLGMADVVVLNDPVTSQGANNAIKSAASYLAAIDAHQGPLDEQWMRETFDRFWRGWARYATAWTSAWLQPLEAHQWRALQLAGEHPELADVVAAGFDDARLFHPWWFDADAAERFVQQRISTEAARFDSRDLRRALGQYATGVTVVTTAVGGERFAMTANSFTSVSLNPPLVLWAAARSSPSLAAFEHAEHFVVNVLASDQHHLSRQFATSGGDKFEGVPLVSEEGLPVLEGTVAHFLCRRTQLVDAGDHVVIFGEIESYDAPGGEPLVFHSGVYRLTTKHPDL
jgi:flavin reductase (DIM6/NTAB) family NADH-FMN oxidoreductase RutF/2-polyprenyl-6-methoxyphenol hydroxylase-like FAD-dependent oxidoreductase